MGVELLRLFLRIAAAGRRWLRRNRYDVVNGGESC